MTYRVEVEANTHAKIREYIRYLAIEQQAPQAAELMLRRIWDAIDSLETFPGRCPLAPENEFREPEIRMRLVGPCLILFTKDEESSLVTIIGFRHGRALPEV